MIILQSEIQDSEPGSFNYMLADLIKRVEVYMKTPSSETGEMANELKELEAKLNEFHRMLDEPEQEYILQIIDAINKVESDKDDFRKDLANILFVLPGEIYNEGKITVDQIDFDLYSKNGITFVDYIGLKVNSNEKLSGLVEDIVRSMAAKYGFIFVRTVY